MDVRAKQRLCFGGVFLTQTCAVAVSPHVISIVGCFLLVCENMQLLDFVKNWNAQDEREVLLRFPSESLTDLKISVEAQNFLLAAGLPDSAAPFLSFEVPKSGSLPTVSQAWQLPETYSHFRVIGFNGSGDPICLDEKAFGAVVFLNHDNNFERVLMNSSVLQLAESLLVFRSCVQKKTTTELEAWCSEELKRIDETAWQQSNFWREEVVMLRN